jgi:hypothetical protein
MASSIVNKITVSEWTILDGIGFFISKILMIGFIMTLLPLILAIIVVDTITDGKLNMFKELR